MKLFTCNLSKSVILSGFFSLPCIFTVSGIHVLDASNHNSQLELNLKDERKMFSLNYQRNQVILIDIYENNH